MKAMVIGAAGFVGSYLVDAIKADLLCDICVTKLPHHQLKAADDVEVLDMNVLDEAGVNACLSRVEPDYVFYLAAQSSISQSWKEPTKTVEVNVAGSLNVLDSIRALRKPPRVLMVGSGEEYGTVPPEYIPIKEETRLDPQNIYAATKACQSMMASIYRSAYGLQLISVRAFNHIGPGQSDRFVVSDFCHQIARIEAGLQEPVIRVGNLQAKRDFTDVRDVVRAYTSLIQFGVPGEIYNVGSGHAVSIQSILTEACMRSRRAIRVCVDPGKFRPIDTPVIEADVSKIFAASGWKPKIPLADTIEDMLGYWREKCGEERA